MTEFNIYENREPIEWTNTWIENCNEKDKLHILLIGDSIARSFRRTLGSVSGYSVDFIGTSYYFDDPCFYDIFEAFFKNNVYKYSKVFINIGCNHSFCCKTLLNENEKEKYRLSFDKFLQYISNITSEIIIISGTPWVKQDNLSEYNTQVNSEIMIKNAIQKNLANKYGYRFVNLYSHVIDNRDVYRYKDQVHFSSKIEKELPAKFLLDEQNALETIQKFRKNRLSQIFSVKFSSDHIVVKIFGMHISFKNKKLNNLITKFGIKQKDI